MYWPTLLEMKSIHHEGHALRFWLSRLEFVVALDDFASFGPLSLLRWNGGEQSRQLCDNLVSVFADKQLRICSVEFCKDTA